MAPLKPVKSLYELSADCFLKDIQFNKIYQSSSKCLRKHLVTFIPGTVRNYIIDQAVSRLGSQVSVLLRIVSLLGDPAIKALAISKPFNHINCYITSDIFSTIDNSDIIGLHELDIKVPPTLKVVVNEPGPLSGLYNALSRGLASTLRVLIFHLLADNQTLKLIGKHALHLTHLEITSSWQVDDSGIADLLLKDCTKVMDLPWSELENRQAKAIHTFSCLPPSELNRTCETLYEVKIQDTNTSSVSVILLLMLAKNLKSFGGFLYDRNIGDTVLEVQSRSSVSSAFALTKLWDMDLPPVKLDKLLKALPKLSHLYTKAVWLHEVHSIPPLTELTADFGLVHYDYQFFNFLENYGRTIRRLVLIDQVYGLDLVTIAEACPLLEELSAKVYVDNTSKKTCSLLSNLQFAEIQICSPQTFSWLMKQADNIKHLEVLFEHKTGGQELFENSVIRQLAEDKPKSLKSITRLGIHIMSRTIHDRLAFSCGMLHIDAAYTLCRACSSLSILGELETWLQVSEQDVFNMAEYIKKSNWNVKLRYRHNLYPPS